MAIDLTSMNRTQLDDLITRARERQEELEKEKIARLREKFNQLAQAEGLTIEDVVGRTRTRSARKTGKVKPKYRNPADSEQTWSGRGKRPRWFVAALDAGRTPESMLIE